MIEFKTYSEDRTANGLIKQFEQENNAIYNAEKLKQMKDQHQEDPTQKFRFDIHAYNVKYSYLQDEHLNGVRALYMREQVSETTFREVLRHITGDEYYFID